MASYKQELGAGVRRYVAGRMAEAQTLAQVLAAQDVDQVAMDAIAAQVRSESRDWVEYRVLAVEGVRLVQDWRSKRKLVIRHWRAVYACCRQGDPSLLAEHAGVLVGRVELETDPAEVGAADHHGVLKLPGSPEEPAPWHPELGR
jgi:hypothetical protein